MTYTKLRFSSGLQRRALVDTGACANVISKQTFDDLKDEKSLYRPLKISESKLKRVRMAGGQLVPIETEVTLEFKLADMTFVESFLVLHAANSIILGNPFYKKHHIHICAKYNLLHFPDLTLQINEIKPPNKPRRINRVKKFPLILRKRQTIAPHQTILVECHLKDACRDMAKTTEIVMPSKEFEENCEIAFTSSISEVLTNNLLYITAFNITDHHVTLPFKTEIGKFSILTLTEAENLIPIDAEMLAFAKMNNPDDIEMGINELIQQHCDNQQSQQQRQPEYEKFWFPTPETCQNPVLLPQIQRDIYDQILHFQGLEKIEPKMNFQDRLTFIKNFKWENSVLTHDQRSKVEDLLVEFSDIFAKHRFDVGYNSDLKIKLKPEHTRPLYTQGPPTPIHLRQELTVELALMHYYGLITTLSHSKYSSPLFAHRKPSGKLRMLIDLRRINHSLKNDYINSNFPISNMTDASNHFAGKSLFTKLDCSQAYHCVQMADDLSVQLLAFNFGSRTYAYKCLAQGLSKSVTGFSSFIRHYLDPCLAADLCTQFMDDIGSAVNNFDELIPTLSKIFECVRKSGLKLSPNKCEIGTQRMKFLGNIITPAGISPEQEKISTFLKKIKMPQTVKQVKRLIGFVQFFRNYMPSLGEKLIPFYRLLRKDIAFQTNEEHQKSLEVLKHDLIQATDITLRLPKPGLQYVILCDASYHGTGFVLMVEDYVKTDNKGEMKTYAPVSFGSRLFNTAQLKFSIYYKEFLALYFALDHFSHFIWGSSKPVIILTDNRSLTQFFQAKTIPPSVWNFLDRVMSFNIIIAHIPGKANYAADFLSRMQTDPSVSLSLKLTDKIPVREIQIDTTAKLPDASLNLIHSMDDAFPEKKKIDDNLRAQLLELGLYENVMRELSSQEASATIQPQNFVRITRPIIAAVQHPDPADVFSDLNMSHEVLDLKNEQDKDNDIVEVKDWKRNEQVPNLTYENSRKKKYAKQFNRLIIDDEVLYRNFYDDTGHVKHKQYCLPKHLWNEVVYRLHNSRTGGHLGMTRTTEEFRKRFYLPGFTEFLTNTIKNCLTCLQLKRASAKYQIPPLQPISSLQCFPGDMMQIDIVGPLKSPVYKFVLTGIDVFSKYLFAAPLTNASADTVARELTKIFFMHSYIPKKIIADLGTTFTSELMHELTTLLEVQINHATLKHPQSIGLVERSHGPLKRILKLNTNEQWSDWHKYVPLATFIHNTSYSSSIGCCPSSIFHGREPTKPLDLRFSTKAMESVTAESDFVTAMQDAMLEKFKETKKNLISSYHKYRGYYDQKALAQPLTVESFCLLLNPLLTTQSDFGSKSMQVWIPLYRVEKVLTNSNYIIRKVGTNYTQCVHRIRLRPVDPQYQPEDLNPIDPTKFQTDPSLGKYRSEPGLFDKNLPKLLDEIQPDNPDETDQPAAPARIRLSVPFGAPAVAAAPAPMPIPAAPIVVPLPVPVPVIPPPPDPPPIPGAVHVHELPLAELPAAPPMDIIDEQVTDRLTSNNSDPEGYNLDELFREPQPVVRRKAAAEARDRIHAQIWFSNDVRYHPIPSRPKQPRKYGLRTVDGHEVAPVTFIPRSTQKDNKANIRKKAEAANEDFPSRDSKRNIIMDSVKRAKQFTKQKDGPGSSKDSVNAIYEPNIFVGSGDVLQFPGSIAHCVSSDFQMAKGVAQQISGAYPCIKPTLKSIETPIVGSSVSVSLPWENKSIFNLVTKPQFFDKPTYYDLSRSLNCMKQQLLQKGINAIAMPKIGCGLDKLKESRIFSLICDIFEKTNIKIFIYV